MSCFRRNPDSEERMDPSAEKNPEQALAKIENDFTRSSMDAVKVAEDKNYEVDQEIETSVSVSEVSLKE